MVLQVLFIFLFICLFFPLLKIQTPQSGADVLVLCSLDISPALLFKTRL